MKKKIVIIPILSCFFLLSCSDRSDTETDTGTKQVNSNSESSENDKVRCFVLSKGPFSKELLSNGKLESAFKADLRFQVDGIIAQLPVQEGEHVSRGQLIAAISDDQPRLNLRQATLGYQQSVLDFHDQLLRAGYKISDTTTMDTRILNIAKLRSGLRRSELELQKSKLDLERTRLVAPFDGKIANLKARVQNSSSNATGNICTLVNDGKLEVSFQVLEQEIMFLRRARRILIYPFSDAVSVFPSVIKSINPIIDQAGMVTVRAMVENRGNILIDGMNVRISVQQNIDGLLVVPKQAVLDRKGRKVVFTVKNGRSKWNYVEIAGENSSQYALQKGLNEGDSVIYEGNFNLVDNKSVSKM